MTYLATIDVEELEALKTMADEYLTLQSTLADGLKVIKGRQEAGQEPSAEDVLLVVLGAVRAARGRREEVSL